MTVFYSIRPTRPEAHLFEATCTVDAPDPAGQRFALPAWIPGSYMIREFAKNIVHIEARQGRRALALRKLDKHTWQAAPTNGPITVTMRVYARDLSVRGAHLDLSHGFFNGTSVFLRVVGRESERCEITIRPPTGARYRRWRVATALERAGASPYGFGKYAAADYDELIDSPVEMGTFTLATFRAFGVPHDIAITGRHDADMARLCRDLKRVCEQHIAFFGRPAPMRRYVFLVTAVGSGYGGLEHRASTALLCSRDDLPRPGVAEITETYRGFLGLCSHEYFHTWNVKRIKPASFVPYDLDRENYTRLLWAFEGLTSYYDDLALVRAGLIDADTYLGIVAKTITGVMRTPGRKVQPVAEASWDAWIKYYRADENAPNAQISYYTKGALIGLCLDLVIRARTRGSRSLDDVMRLLWKRYGRTGVGVPEDGVERVAAEVAGGSLASFFGLALRSTRELPLASLLADVGIRLTLRPATSASDRGGFTAGAAPTSSRPRVSIGARIAPDGDAVKLTHVLEGGAAQHAGLAADDVVVALDGLRVTSRTFEDRLGRARVGQRVHVHAFRRDELIETRLVVRAATADTCDLGWASDAARRRAQAWLGQRSR